MNYIEIGLLLQAGVKPEIIQRVVVAGELQIAMRRADAKMGRAFDRNEDVDERALMTAESVMQMF